MDTNNPVPEKRPTHWKLVTFSFMGLYWAVNFLLSAAAGNFEGVAPGTALALIGFGAPVLEVSSRLVWRRIAFWICVFEAGISPLLWIGIMIHFADPLILCVRILSLPIVTVTSGGGMFLYYLVRAAIFSFAAFLAASASHLDESGPAGNRIRKDS